MKEILNSPYKTNVKLFWILPHPTHYWIYFFNKLSKTNTVNFEIVFSNKMIESYPWAFNFDIKFPYSIFSKKLGFNFPFTKNL